MTHRNRNLGAVFALVLSTILGICATASADVPVPAPRPPRPTPQPANNNNGTVFITVKENASPAQLELPRAMTRRDSRRSDAGETGGRIRFALIAGAGTSTLLLAAAMGVSRMGQFRGERAMMVLIGAGIALTAGASIVVADLSVRPPPQPAKVEPPPAPNGPTVTVRATEDAKGVMLVVSPDVLRKAIANAEAAKGDSKK